MTAGQSAAAERAPENELATLIGLCADGDRDALASLYDRSAAQVNGLALRILADREAAEEVTVDVYFQAWRSASSYDPDRGSPLAWLLTLARSRAIDRLRASASQRRATDPLQAAFDLASDDLGPEDGSAASQQRRIVQAAVARLAPGQRRAIELAFFHGLSHSEVARELGEPLGTVKTRVRLGMIRLREMLGATGRDTL